MAVELRAVESIGIFPMLVVGEAIFPYRDTVKLQKPLKALGTTHPIRKGGGKSNNPSGYIGNPQLNPNVFMNHGSSSQTKRWWVA